MALRSPRWIVNGMEGDHEGAIGAFVLRLLLQYICLKKEGESPGDHGITMCLTLGDHYEKLKSSAAETSELFLEFS